MDPNEVRGTINGALYGVIFSRALTEERVDSLVRTIAEDDRERFRKAITIVMNDGRLPEPTIPLAVPHTQADLLGFLARVRARLDDDSTSGAE